MAALLQSGIFRITVAIVAIAVLGGTAAMLVERRANTGMQTMQGCSLVSVRYPDDGRVW